MMIVKKIVFRMVVTTGKRMVIVRKEITTICEIGYGQIVMAELEGLDLRHLVAAKRGGVKEVTMETDRAEEADAVLQEGETLQDVQEVGDLPRGVQEMGQEGDTDLHQDVQEMGRGGGTDEGHRAVGIEGIKEEEELEIQVVKIKLIILK